MKRVIDGLVLREISVGENDRRILILTAEEGKLWVTAKGARSVKSKFAALCRIFTYGNFEIYDKNGGKWLSGGSTNKSFLGTGADIESYALGSYVLQVADEISGEECPAEEALSATMNTLYAIEKKLAPLSQIKAAYELFAACTSGFTPNVDFCMECQCEDFDGELWLDVMNGGVLCNDCLQKRSGGLPLPETDSFDARNILVPIDTSALEAMRYVTTASPKRLFAFGLTDNRSLALFCRAAEAYLLNHLERDFDTLHFYNSIKD